VSELFVGTSGWTYPNWKNRFYPKGLAQSGWFAFYAARFRAVEINNSFYQFPKPETVEAWRRAAPEGFVFAVKANRYVTHMKKLKEPEDACRRFLEIVRGFGEKLGPVLFQLPPRWRYDDVRLRDFLDALPEGFRYVFEFRDERWINDRCLELLAGKGAALCVADLAGTRTPMKPATATADFAYFRLHGPDEAYQGLYGREGLEPFADAIRAERAAGRDVYCFFDNDQDANAPMDAGTLAEMLG